MNLPYEDALDYVPLGCGEMTLYGKGVGSPNSTTRFLKALEAALHNGRDGADGLLRLRQAGAPTIGQDRETCVVYGMPRIAQERGALLYQLPLPQIGPAIQKIAGARY